MKNLIRLFLLLLSTFSFAQEELKNIELIDTSALNADAFVGYDKFDYLYYIKNNTLFKIKNGVSLEYKNVALGQITKVDLLNPLKIIVFYEQFNTAVTLDNQMNEILKINFSEIKTPLIVSKIGIASQNQLWIYDEFTSQIYLYDTGNGALKSIGTPISEENIFYTTNFNYFEWMDSKNNWYQCSIFGEIQKLEYQIDFDKILFANNELLFYKKQQTLFTFDRKTNKINTIENIDKTFESLTFQNQILSIFTNQGISNYKITIP